MPRDENRRRAILAAAGTAFAERGFAATSMDDVAAAAGITRLVVYRHFASKEALYAAVLEQVSTRLAEEFTAAVSVEGNAPIPTGRASVVALMRVGREDPGGFTLLWRHAAREPKFADYAEQFRGAVVAMVTEMLNVVDLGDPRHTRWAAETLVTYVVSAVLHWLEHGSPHDDSEVVEQIAGSLPAIVSSWVAVAGATVGQSP